MKLARRSLHDPDRELELEERLDNRVVDIVAEANDAGYGTEEVLDALDDVIDNQKLVYAEDPDPADDPEPEEPCVKLRVVRPSSR